MFFVRAKVHVELSYCSVHCNFPHSKRVTVQSTNLLCSHLITVNRPIPARLTQKALAHKASGQ